MKAFIIYLVISAIIGVIVGIYYCKENHCKWDEILIIVFCAAGIYWLILPKYIAELIYKYLYK